MSDFLFFFELGWQHIISTDALDHQYFILALVAIYTFGDFKQILILVTAFTIGHSLTLLLSVMDILRLPSKLVEFLIPCTIVIRSLHNVLSAGFSNRNMHASYVLALVFGLIHGMGFANTIRVMLARDQTMGMGLFGFNIGLEAGQVIVVGIILVITAIALSLFKIKRREWVLFLSSCVFALSLKMSVERFPW